MIEVTNSLVATSQYKAESSVDEKQRYRGIVREFNLTRGLGFIEMEGGEKPVTVHYSAIQGDGVRVLQAGQVVSFELENTRQGPTASRVFCQPD